MRSLIRSPGWSVFDIRSVEVVVAGARLMWSALV